MKKIIGILLILVLLYTTLIPINATKIYDSVNIPESEVKQVQYTPTDTVVKLYNGYYTLAFAEHLAIEDIVEGDYILEPTYLVSGSNISYRVIRNGKVSTINHYSNPTYWNEYYQYALDPHLVFGNLVRISAVYCLDGEPSMDGVYIYYKTNVGDYILFKEYLQAEKTYFFTVEEFTEVAEILYTERKAHANEDGIALASTVCDITQYEFTGQLSFFSLRVGWLIFGVVITIVALVAISVIILKKKEKRRK